MLANNQFVKSTNSVTDEVEEYPPAIIDMEAVIKINGEFDKYGIENWLATLHSLHEKDMKAVVTENTSDGYHTFKELYEFRKIYNAILFNEWFLQGKFSVHKSKKHSDGEECFGGGWFIVVATLPTGDISNHYEMKDWDLFVCEEREKAKEWDGHSAQDVVSRLLSCGASQRKEAQSRGYNI